MLSNSKGRWVGLGASALITATGLRLAVVGTAAGAIGAFGRSGEGYVRVALCVAEDRLREATQRMAEAGFGW